MLVNQFSAGKQKFIFSITTVFKAIRVSPKICNLFCRVPAQFTGAWEQYSEFYCFVQNTYFVPFTEELPTAYDERDRREIGYYQWVPFVLALQAFLFFLPIMIWRLLNWQSGKICFCLYTELMQSSQLGVS